MKEISLQELMEQRFPLGTPAEPELMSEEEQQELLATASPKAPALKESDTFSPFGRRFVAPIIKRNGDPSTAVQIQKLSNKHLAVMDFMLANPRASMLEVANEFGMTQAWLSTVKNSDLWRDTFNERRQLLQEHQKIIIGDQLAAIASKGLTALEHAVDDPDTTLASKLAITKLALEHSGMSAAEQVSPISVKIDNSQNVTVVDESKRQIIEAARARVLAKAAAQNATRYLEAVTVDGKPE